MDVNNSSAAKVGEHIPSSFSMVGKCYCRKVIE